MVNNNFLEIKIGDDCYRQNARFNRSTKQVEHSLSLAPVKVVMLIKPKINQYIFSKEKRPLYLTTDRIEQNNVAQVDEMLRTLHMVPPSGYATSSNSLCSRILSIFTSCCCKKPSQNAHRRQAEIYFDLSNIVDDTSLAKFQKEFPDIDIETDAHRILLPLVKEERQKV